MGQILVPVLHLGVPHAGGGLKHGSQSVGLALVRAEDAEVLSRFVGLDDIPDVFAQHQHILCFGGAGGGQVHAVLAEVRQLQVPQELAAVGVGVGTHAAVALGGQGLQVGPQLALLGEELLGLVAAQPSLQELEVVGLGHVDGDLVGAEVALDGLAVHFLRAGPALGGAEDNHGPGGAAVVTHVPGVGLDAANFPDGPVQGTGHGLVHLLRLVALHEAHVPAVAVEEVRQLALGDTGENGRVMNLEPVQVQDGQHRAVPDGVEELVAMPGGGQGAGLGLAVAHDAGSDQIGVIQHRAEGVGQGVAQLAALMDGAGCLGGHVAGDAAGEGELLEELLQALFILADVGVDLAVGPLQIGLRDHSVAAVTGAGEVDHVQVILVDDPVQVCIDEVLTRDGAPVTNDLFLDLCRFERLFQQGVVQKVQLAGGQVVRGPPVGVNFFQLGRRQGSFPGDPGSRFCNGFGKSLRFSRHGKKPPFRNLPVIINGFWK